MHRQTKTQTQDTDRINTDRHTNRQTDQTRPDTWTVDRQTDRQRDKTVTDTDKTQVMDPRSPFRQHSRLRGTPTLTPTLSTRAPHSHSLNLTLTPEIEPETNIRTDGEDEPPTAASQKKLSKWTSL